MTQNIYLCRGRRLPGVLAVCQVSLSLHTTPPLMWLGSITPLSATVVWPNPPEVTSITGSILVTYYEKLVQAFF